MKQDPNISSGQVYARSENLLVERAAFDHIEQGARMVIVGITPGAQQRDLADAAMTSAIAKGKALSDASRSAKFAASFGGVMRKNLISMLDCVGANRLLAMETFGEAFDPAVRGKVHFTSALRYPVFYRGANYNGQVDMLAEPILREMVETLLVEEASRLPGAIWQPLGDKPRKALEHLVTLGKLDARQIAPTLPHPSGASMERINFFLGKKDERDLSVKTNPGKIKGMRSALTEFYSDHARVSA